MLSPFLNPIQHQVQWGGSFGRVLAIFCLALAFVVMSVHPVFAEYYQYRGKDGKVHITDNPDDIPTGTELLIRKDKLDGLTEEEKTALKDQERLDQESRAAAFQKDLERAKARKLEEQMERAAKNLEKLQKKQEGIETPIIVHGNQVLIPTTLSVGGASLEVLMLLDTGASITTLHQSYASKLEIRGGQRHMAYVAGGRPVQFFLVTLDSMAFGPVHVDNVDVGVMEQIGPEVAHAGLLGMNVLGKLKYTIDFKQGVIHWMP